MPATLLPATIFLSHRRIDTAPQAQSLAPALRLQGWPVFMDVDSISYGQSIHASIHQAMAGTQILLVLIGNKWNGVDTLHATSRFDDPNDVIRIEIEAAIQRGAFILPVRVDNAELPRYSELPLSLIPIVDLKAMPLRHDDYVRDTANICMFIDEVARQRGLGDRAGTFGKITLFRGQRVRLCKADLYIKKETTGTVEVKMDRQVGNIVGILGDRVLVRFDAQEWTKALMGKSLLVPKTQLPMFDLWIPGSALVPVS